MYCCVRDVEGFSVRTVDGQAGVVQDLLFDELSWIIRYLVVDTRDSLAKDQVMILMLSVARINWENKTVPVNLTLEGITHSPSFETNQPVSRNAEQQIYQYYGRTPYWGAGPGFGAQAIADWITAQGDGLLGNSAAAQPESHLRSMARVTGISVGTSEEVIGQIVDYVVEDNNWIIRYLVVKTKDDRHVLISPQWLERINWADEIMTTGLDAGRIRSAPAYNYGGEVTRVYERALYQHLDQPVYWE